jgi:hypothetical protein
MVHTVIDVDVETQGVDDYDKSTCKVSQEMDFWSQMIFDTPSCLKS